MNEMQRNALTALCKAYNVDFDESKYVSCFDLPTGFDLPAGYVAGWVGPIYVGCSPEGEITAHE